MAFLRRRGPEPVPPVAPALPEAAALPHAEHCPYCRGEIVLDADNPSDLLVAMLVERPGHPPHVVAHRACAERASGRLLAL
jgi:hypothetical protein